MAVRRRPQRAGQPPPRLRARRLDESATTTFAGRPARRYVVGEDAPPAGAPRAPADSEEYYLDAETGEPLGFKRVYVLYTPRIGKDRKPVPDHSKPSGTATYVTTVEALEHLPATPENQAKLSG